MYHFSGSGTDPYRMCRKAGQMEAAKHDNAETSVVLDILYHKTACVQMDFQGFLNMDLRGIEPLSESLSIQASPITVILLTFP